SIGGLGTIHLLDAAREPAVSPVHRLAGIVVFAWPWCALIECHNDITADEALGVDDIFRSKSMARSIDVGCEQHSFFCYLARATKGVYLVSTAVCQYGAIPAVELMKSPRAVQHGYAGSQVEVVRIAKNDLRADVAGKLTHVHALHRSGRTYRHKDWRVDFSVRRADYTSSRAGAGICCKQLKLHKRRKIRLFMHSPRTYSLIP